MLPTVFITHGTTKYMLNFSAWHYEGMNFDINIALFKHNFAIYIRKG